MSCLPPIGSDIENAASWSCLAATIPRSESCLSRNHFVGASSVISSIDSRITYFAKKPLAGFEHQLLCARNLLFGFSISYRIKADVSSTVLSNETYLNKCRFELIQLLSLSAIHDLYLINATLSFLPLI